MDFLLSVSYFLTKICCTALPLCSKLSSSNHRNAVDLVQPIILAGIFSLEAPSLVNTSIFLMCTFAEVCSWADGAVARVFLSAHNTINCNYLRGFCREKKKGKSPSLKPSETCVVLKASLQYPNTPPGDARTLYHRGKRATNSR